MSALSSATRMRAVAGRRLDRARPVGRGRDRRSIRQPAQRLLRRTAVRARWPSARRRRRAPMRSAGRCAMPSGMRHREGACRGRPRCSHARRCRRAARTSSCTSASPMPDALVRARARAARPGGSARRRAAARSAAMPTPVSRTVSSTSTRRQRAARRAIPPSNVNLNAFEGG